MNNLLVGANQTPRTTEKTTQILKILLSLDIIVVADLLSHPAESTFNSIRV